MEKSLFNISGVQVIAGGTQERGMSCGNVVASIILYQFFSILDFRFIEYQLVAAAPIAQ
jgi:hypothetical protein